MLTSWFLAARPKTLLASVAPVAIGSALAARGGAFHAVPAIAALLGAMCIQIGTNFCNDYCDFFQGADTDDRKGPTRAVQSGLISPPAMFRATVAMFGLTGLICVYLVARAGWPLLVVGGLSILLGVLYTAGKNSLAYLGLGDLFVLVFFGPVAVGGTYYVQALHLPWWIPLAGVAPGLISVGLLVINNLRDIEEDRVANKRTLAVRLGRRFSRWQYALCLVAAACVPILLWQQGHLPPLCLAASVSIVPALFLIRHVWQNDGAKLNPNLGKTAGLLLTYTLLFSVGCLFG